MVDPHPAPADPAASLPGAAPERLTRWIATGLLLAAVMVLPQVIGQRAWHATFATYFLAIVLEALPYILIGSLLSGVIETFLPAAILPRWSRRMGRFAIPGTVLLSPAFPVCECGVVTVARGLLRKGLPAPQAVAYLLAAPTLNPTVLFTTWLAFDDWRFPVLRAIGGMGIALLVGLLTARLRVDRVLLPGIAGTGSAPAGPDDHGHDHAHAGRGGHDHAHDHGHGHGHGDDDAHGHGHDHAHDHARGHAQQPGWRSRLSDLAGHVGDDFLGMMAFFLVGVAIAAGMKTFLGPAVLEQVAPGPVSGPLAMMGGAFVLSLCAEADAFVAATFTQFPLPALIAFLVFGPMVDIKLLLMYGGVFQARFVALLALSTAVLTLGYALLLGALT